MTYTSWSGKVQYNWPVGTRIMFDGQPGWVHIAETSEVYMAVKLDNNQGATISQDNCHRISLLELNPFDLEPLE